MSEIISMLLLYIEVQNKIIVYLIGAVLGKNSYRKNLDKPVNKPYPRLHVDALPIIEIPEKLNYLSLLQEYHQKHGKNLKPVKPHKNSKARVPHTLSCPCCGAPSSYIYDNNGGRGQYKCKVCSTNFNFKNYYSKAAIIKCPHCNKSLEKIKERKDFYIYKCKNDDCSFYQRNLTSMSSEEKKSFIEKPHEFKVRYIYRQFNFEYKPLSRVSPVVPKVDISKIYASPHTLGLILTYHVNYGISARKTAALMQDVHNLNISHRTVLNYADSVAKIVKPFVDYYPYDVSNSFCGDETYIRVNGKWHYLFFFFDAVKKIILSYPVSPNRDTLSAVKALDQVLMKFKDIPDDLNFIVDGNPIYVLAQHFFAQHDVYFDITQVIGLTNDDPVSKEFRPLKQIIERLNRTFKGNYRATHGFNSDKGSISFVTLFVAYFNFLRPHAALEHKVPVVVPELTTLPNMPARWSKLIELSQEFLINQQIA